MATRLSFYLDQTIHKNRYQQIREEQMLNEEQIPKEWKSNVDGIIRKCVQKINMALLDGKDAGEIKLPLDREGGKFIIKNVTNSVNMFLRGQKVKDEAIGANLKWHKAVKNALHDGFVLLTKEIDFNDKATQKTQADYIEKTFHDTNDLNIMS